VNRLYFVDPTNPLGEPLTKLEITKCTRNLIQNCGILTSTTSTDLKKKYAIYEKRASELQLDSSILSMFDTVIEANTLITI